MVGKTVVVYVKLLFDVACATEQR